MTAWLSCIVFHVIKSFKLAWCFSFQTLLSNFSTFHILKIEDWNSHLIKNCNSSIFTLYCPNRWHKKCSSYLFLHFSVQPVVHLSISFNIHRSSYSGQQIKAQKLNNLSASYDELRVGFALREVWTSSKILEL
jgi:hypothetical protein